MRRYGLAWLALVVLSGANCFPTLDNDGSTPPVEKQACNDDANCDDKDQCTVNRCGDNKTCEYLPVDGIAPEQKAGDCQQGFCAMGILTQNPDDADIPDDLELCTKDTCVNGVATFVQQPDDTPCALGSAAGLCKSGKCIVDCLPQKPCNDGNPCTEDTCNANTGACSFAILDGLPTPGYLQIVGDCSQQICVGGVSTALGDDADLPNDKSPCTKDICSMGAPDFIPTNVGAGCLPDGSGSCDSNGVCLECINAADCPPLANENGCRVRTCTNNKCGEMFAPAGTEVESDPGDCKRIFCDGAGNVTVQNSATDVPDDNNLCTKDLCTNGTPSHTFEPANTSCGAGALKCNAMGQCQGCTTAADCPGTDDFCKARTCTNMTCGVTYAPAGTDLPVGQTAGDCKVNQCDGMGNVVFTIDAFDISDDMNDCTLDSCTAQGLPTNTFKPVNAACNQNGGTVCNGFGACLDELGANCADGAQCASGFCTDGVCCTDTCTGECMACNVMGAQGTCTNVTANSDDAPLCTGTNSCDGMGSCKRDNGQPCGIASDCSSGFCADGVCCESACTETCKSCDRAGNVGICTAVASYTTDPNAAAPCINPYQCDGQGACKGLNGVTCTQATECLSANCVDGFCCNNTCNQLCYACSGALTGNSNGACRPILNGTDPQNECPNGSCNGSGSCTGAGGSQANGTSCTTAGQCMSGFCVDGVCCGTACTETCKSCNLAASIGTCTFVPNDVVDPTGSTPCNNPQRCDGQGLCKALNGVACSQPIDCLSGYCVDGFCCGNICNQLCKACSSALTGGVNGACTFVYNGTDPQNECSGATPNCNGAGICGP